MLKLFKKKKKKQEECFHGYKEIGTEMLISCMGERGRRNSLLLQQIRTLLDVREEEMGTIWRKQLFSTVWTGFEDS